MAALQLSPAEQGKVLRERFAHPNKIIQQRMETLHLRSLGKTYSEISQIIGCCEASVSKWLRIYRCEGLTGIKTLKYGREQSKLAKHREKLEKYFKEHPIPSIREAQVKIEELTGLKRSERVIREFLRSMGMSYRKSGRVPGKADREAQEEFKKKCWSLV